MKLELRSNSVTFDSSGDLIVSGYVNQTEQLSEVLGTTKKFREKIVRGAFARAIEKAKEIDFLASHDNTKVLSSTRNGSLTLKEDETGLFMEARITPTSYGKDTYELIKSGIIKNMSFGFRAIKDSWSRINNEIIRTVEELELFEVSAVKNPAYAQSSLSARSIDLIQVEVPDEISENYENKRSETKMEMKKMETRNTEATLNEIMIEERTLQVTANGATLIPENVADQIIIKMEETSPAFAAATKIESVTGDLKVARETAVSAGGFVAEGQNLAEVDLTLEEIKLTQKRVGAAMSISQKLINDSAVDLDAYVGNLLARKVAKAVEKSMFTGSVADEFKGILGDADIAHVDQVTADGLTIDILMETYNTIHPDFLNKSAWYMARPLFNLVARLKDGNGHFYLQNGIVNGKITYTLLGFPCYVTDALSYNSTTLVGSGCVFGNIEEAYAVMIKKGFALQKVVGDTTQALRGSALYVFDGYMDGAVVNPQALAKLVYTAV